MSRAATAGAGRRVSAEVRAATEKYERGERYSGGGCLRRAKLKRVIRISKTNSWGRWIDAVAHMMAEPRSALKYSNCFPTEDTN